MAVRVVRPGSVVGVVSVLMALRVLMVSIRVSRALMVRLAAVAARAVAVALGVLAVSAVV